MTKNHGTKEKDRGDLSWRKEKKSQNQAPVREKKKGLGVGVCKTKWHSK